LHDALPICMLLQGYGRSLRLFDAARIIAFEDHTSYVAQSPAHLRQGLVSNMQRMCQAHRDFVAETKVRSHRTLTEAEVLADDGSNRSEERRVGKECRGRS